jgi:competence protein ComEA
MFNLKQQELLLFLIIIILSSILFDYIKISYTCKNIIIKKVSIPQDQIVVEIEGGVKKEGIYSHKKETNLEEALIKAGGLLDKINISRKNLKKSLKDGTKIKITHEGNIKITNLDGIKKLVYFKQIDLNQANFNDLLPLPGVGPGIAGKILIYRKEKGEFKKKEELMKIKGIGKKYYQKIKSYVSI